MVRELESEALRDLFLSVLDELVLKFKDATANGANEMVVVIPDFSRLIQCRAIAKSTFRGNPCLYKEL